MRSKGISRLNQMKKCELIEEIRNNQLNIAQLKKELKKQKFIWQRYYRQEEYRQRLKKTVIKE